MSVIKHKEQRVAVLIDTQNLYHSAKNLYHARVNFKHLVDVALGDRRLVRALAYVVNTESGEEESFFEALEKSGIEIKTKDLQVFFGGAKKADWDVGLAVDAIKLAQKVDAIVIASGDGDFVPLVEYVKGQGCQVEAITFGRSTSARLIEAVDDFINLDENPEDFLINYKRRKSYSATKKQSLRKTISKKSGAKKTSGIFSQVVGTDTDDL